MKNISKKLLAMIMFASVMVSGVPITTTTANVENVLQPQQEAAQQPQQAQEQQAQASSTVSSEGLPLTYPGFATIQPVASSDAGGALQYSTEPILEQLRGMSPDSNFGRLGAFPTSSVMERQTATFSEAVHGGAKPIPQSFVQPMIDNAMLSQQLPASQYITAPVAEAFPQAKQPKPIKEFKFVNAPLTNQYETLPVKELPNVIQHYSVPSTFTTQENIKQPITQPVWQPYLQRYEQRAVPVVQPVVNRVMQPIIHRQLHPYVTSKTVQGPQQQAIINAPKVLEFNNAPIVGSELNPSAMEDRSRVPSLPAMGAATAKRPAAAQKSHSS